MFVIAPFLLSNSHFATDTVTGNDDLGVRPGRIRTMRASQAESFSRSHSDPRRRRGGFRDGRARSGRKVRTRSPGEPSRNTAPTGTWSQHDCQGTCGPPNAVAWRAASHIGYLLRDEVTRDGSPGSYSTRQATKRTAELSPSAGRDRLPAPRSGKAESVVDLRPERGRLGAICCGNRNRSDADPRAAVPGKPAGPARWILSNEAKQPLRALGAREELSPLLDSREWSPGLAKCAAAAIGSYLGYTGSSADTLVRPHVVESRCGAVALGCTYLFPPLSSGGALVV